MEDLKFDFIKKIPNRTQELLEAKLKEVGEKLSQYENFYHLVSTTSENNKIKSATLWLLIPIIDYNYRILTLHYQNNTLIVAKFFDLSGQNIKEEHIDIQKNSNNLMPALVRLLKNKEASKALNFLVERVEEGLLQEV